jgi:UDP-N-acetylglucosamine--N-acetylmuramyl-(pentapeptide) pyrophosphoryl-undecaprenol N-acetylglucosamine transferase
MARIGSVCVLAAGGTGGHIFPAEALASALIARGARPVLFTDPRGRSFGGTLGGIEIRRIRAGGIAGVGRLARLKGAIALGCGFVQALWQLRRLSPIAVVGFGGYAALPTMLAACMSGYRTIVHEQNAVLGRANRLVAPRVDRIATAFADVSRLPAEAVGKLVRIGMPTRSAFIALRGRAYVPPDAHGPIRLLVLGGSQGARVFSEVIPQAIARLGAPIRVRLVISQQCRPETLDGVAAAYREIGISAQLASFFADVPERMADAHLVIARAGASTVAELTAIGRPAVLVPYPFAIDDHQAANARALERDGAAIVIEQDTLTAAALAECLGALFANPDALAALASRAWAAGMPEAGDRLADLVLPAPDPATTAGLRGGGTETGTRS